MTYLPLASPDQEDDEDGEHDGSQAHDHEREVGHHIGDGQQLLYSCRWCIVDHHALSKENGKKLKTESRDTDVSPFRLRSQVSYLIEEHDREHSLIQDFSFPVITDGVVTSSHTLWDKQEILQSEKGSFVCVWMQKLTGIRRPCRAGC